MGPVAKPRAQEGLAVEQLMIAMRGVAMALAHAELGAENFGRCGALKVRACPIV